MASQLLPKEVQDLLRSCKDVDFERYSLGLLQSENDSKDLQTAASKVTELARALMSGVAKSCTSKDHLPFVAIAPIIVARQVFANAAQTMHDASQATAGSKTGLLGQRSQSKGPKGRSKDELSTCKIALETLTEMLRIDMKSGRCDLIDHPDEGIGIYKPENDRLGVKISASQSISDASKFAMRLMADLSEATDVLKPLKAVCESLLGIVEQHEAREDLKAQFEDLNTLLSNSVARTQRQQKESGADNQALENEYNQYLCDVHLIYIRVFVLSKTGKTQQFVSAQRMCDVLRDEIENLRASESWLTRGLVRVAVDSVESLKLGFAAFGTKVESAVGAVLPQVRVLLGAHRLLLGAHRLLLRLLLILGVTSLALTLFLGLGSLVFDKHWFQRLGKKGDAIHVDVKASSVKLDLIHSQDEKSHAKTHESLEIIVNQLSWNIRVPDRDVLLSTEAAAPSVVFGRTDLIQTITRRCLATANANARLAILGDPGIGKTTVALAILHHPAIREHYTRRRYFLSSESAVDATDLVKSLATAFGLPPEQHTLADVNGYLSAQPPSLVVIDNLETIWRTENRTIRTGTEKFLNTLSAIPHVAVIVTMRGSIAPEGFTRNSVDTLSFAAARSAFEAVSGPITDELESSSVDTLIRSVDHLPLAVALLAHLVAADIPPSELLERWNTSGSSVLEIPGSSSRLDSISHSISLSLASLPTDDPEPLQFLVIVSHLRDGVREDVVNSLKPQFADIRKAIHTLVLYALVRRTPTREIRMLNPIRDYIRRSNQLPPPHKSALFSFYSDLASRWKRKIDVETRLRDLMPEVPNLEGLLLDAAEGGEELTPILMKIYNSYTEFAALTSSSCTVQDAYVLRIAPHMRPDWSGRILALCGMCHAFRGEARHGLDCFTRARDAFQLHGATKDVRRVDVAMAKIYLDMDDWESAAARLRASQVDFPVHPDKDDELIFAEYCSLHGRGLLSRGALLDAARFLVRAYELQTKHVDYPKLLRTLLSLADAFSLLGGHFTTHDVYNDAISWAVAAKDSDGISDSFCAYATFLQKMHQYEAAADYLEQALTAVRQSGSLSRIAQCKYSLGTVRLQQWRFSEATTLFREALSLLRKEDLVQNCSAYLQLMQEYSPLAEAPRCRLEEAKRGRRLCYIRDMKDLGGPWLQPWSPLVGETFIARALSVG